MEQNSESKFTFAAVKTEEFLPYDEVTAAANRQILSKTLDNT
jgi:hypothetical protein